MPKASRKVASGIFAPAKTEPIWTLSEPVIKVFENGGRARFFSPCRLVFKNPEPVIKMFANGGGCAPPPNPPLFLRHAGCLSRNRTNNKNCVKHVVALAFF